MGRPWIAILGGIIICMGITVPAGAAQTEGVELKEVVVTATRTEVPTKELGVSATVITAAEIERNQTKDAVELFRDVAGVNVTQQGSRGGVTSLFSRGGESNFTLVLIDGIRVNEAGGFFDFSSLDTANIERIEIIRGSQSALYGSDAIGGVINIITKKGKGALTVSASTANGAHSENGHYIGEQKFAFSGESKWVDYSFAYGRSDDKGILNVNNTFWRNAVSGRIDFHPSALPLPGSLKKNVGDITFTLRYDDSRVGIPTENGGDRPDRVFPGLDPDQNRRDQNLTLGLGTRFDLFPWWENVLEAGFYRLVREFNDPPNAESAFDAPPGSFSDTTENRFTFDYHANFRFPREGAIRSILTLGYAYELETFDLNDLSTLVFGLPPFGVFTSTTQSDENRTNNAFYAQEQLTLFDRLHLTAGLRMDNNSKFGTAVNPHGSIAYEIKETGTKLRAAVGTGIKEPTFIENFGGFGTVGNPDLQPERSFSWEVGADQTIWDGKVQLGLTYFQNRYKDLIAFIPTTFPPPPILPPNYFNVQAAKSWGVEFTGKVNPGYGLTLGVNYTYLRTEVTDTGGLNSIFFAEGKPLLRRPTHSASFFADWLWKGLNLHFNGTYVGRRDDSLFLVSPGFFYTFTNLRVVNKDYFVADLTASYKFDVDFLLLKGVKIFAKGQNIFNEHYEEALGFSSPRFSAMGGLELTF
jgi:vitamin B12 transporter